MNKKIIYELSIAFLFSLIILVGTYIIYLDYFSYVNLQKSELKLTEKFKHAKEMSNRYTNPQVYYRKLVSELNFFKTILPVKNNISEFFTQLDQLADGINIKIEKQELGNIKTIETIDYYELVITGSGKYEDVLKYLEKIYQFERLIILSELELNKTKDFVRNNYMLDFKLKGYIFSVNEKKVKKDV